MSRCYLRINKLDGPVPMDNVLLGAGGHGLEAVLDFVVPAHVLAVGSRSGSTFSLLGKIFV